MLAEALDTLAMHKMNASKAAEALGITTSSLVRLLKSESRALQHVNDRRKELGLRPLR